MFFVLREKSVSSSLIGTIAQEITSKPQFSAEFNFRSLDLVYTTPPKFEYVHGAVKMTAREILHFWQKTEKTDTPDRHISCNHLSLKFHQKLIQTSRNSPSDHPLGQSKRGEHVIGQYFRTSAGIAVVLLGNLQKYCGPPCVKLWRNRGIPLA